MVATACNFCYGVLSLFSLYQSLFHYNDRVVYISFSLYVWNCFYNFLLFEFIQNASQLMKEVSVN